MSSTFTYRTALNPDQREVRLITLLPPGHGPSPAKAVLVNCTLQKVSLNDKPDYRALSYVWGSPGTTSPICVDGKIFEATINLEAALRHLRKNEEPITLWVDAICIDQADDVEKSHQVQHMGDIYKGASEVIIWLGQAKPEHSKIWNQLKELGEFAAEEPLEMNFDHLVDVEETNTRAPWFLNMNLGLKKVLSQITIGYNNYDKLLIEPLLCLLTRPWWSRIWVVQESILANLARVVWGPNEMYWGILWAALGYLATWLHFQSIHLMGDESYHKAFFLLERSQPFWVPIVGAWERINRRQDDTKTKLVDMLLQTSISSASMATDPRDRIFGLMGIVDDASELGIQVNYSSDLMTVYGSVAKALLNTEGLTILQCCQFSPLHRSGVLPSWVPDWSSSLRSLLDGLRVLLPRGVYNASDSIGAYEASKSGGLSNNYHNSLSKATAVSDEGRATKLYSFDESKPGILTIQAARVDTILAVGEVWEEAGDVLDCHARDVFWVRELERLAKLGNGVYSEPTKKEALWRTPVADRGLPRLTYIWYPRASGGESLGHSVLMETFSLDGIEEKNRSIWYEKSRTYQKVLRAFGKCRRFFVTKAGLLGLGPETSEVGDVVYIIPGASTPFVLRATGKKKKKKQYRIVGESFVYGIMDGEFMKRKPELALLEVC